MMSGPKPVTPDSKHRNYVRCQCGERYELHPNEMNWDVSKYADFIRWLTEHRSHCDESKGNWLKVEWERI